MKKFKSTLTFLVAPLILSACGDDDNHKDVSRELSRQNDILEKN